VCFLEVVICRSNYPFNITVYYSNALEMFSVNSLFRIFQFLKIVSCLSISSNLGMQELMGRDEKIPAIDDIDLM
jgi:hypothetical protein